MVQALPKPVTFEEFIADYPNNGGRYELVEGEVVEVRPTGKHELIAGFLSAQIILEIYSKNLPYEIPNTCVVKSDRPAGGYLPDIVVLDLNQLDDQPMWEKASTITKGTSTKLVIEVVSTNWRDDYTLKLGDYEALGIPEYWIIDYKALGAERYIGAPKQPTITICTLVDGEYRIKLYRDQQVLESTAFPELRLSAHQIFTMKR